MTERVFLTMIPVCENCITEIKMGEIRQISETNVHFGNAAVFCGICGKFVPDNAGIATVVPTENILPSYACDCGDLTCHDQETAEGHFRSFEAKIAMILVKPHETIEYLPQS